MRICDFILTYTFEEDELREDFKDFIETHKNWEVQNIDQSTYCISCNDTEKMMREIIQGEIKRICHYYKIWNLSRYDEAYLICSMKRHKTISTLPERMFKTDLLSVDL